MRSLYLCVWFIFLGVTMVYGQFNTVLSKEYKEKDKSQILKIENEQLSKDNTLQEGISSSQTQTDKTKLESKELNRLLEEIKKGSFRNAYGQMQGILIDTKQAVESGQPIELGGQKIETNYIMNFIYDMVDFVKSDLTKQIDTELRKKKK